MLVTYLRSSSMGSFEWCQHSYFLDYVLGWKQPAGWKAERGNMVHKALELLARRKLAEQQGLDSFSDPELGREFRCIDMVPDTTAELGFAHYAKKNESGYDWSDVERKEVLDWTHQTVNFRGGIFDPRKRNVLAPEQYFDLTIDEDWSGYTYIDPHTGKLLEGKLGIKGTIDLVTELGVGTIEYIDWKTGKRWDWGKDREKTYERMYEDTQLLLYFYALNRLYPDADTIFVTIFFVQDGGPYTVAFEKRHLKKALAKLKRKFEEIKNTVVPRRILNDQSKRWKCERLCHFHANTHPDSGDTLCEHIHREVVSLGTDRVVAKYGKPGAFSSYGSGGGQTNREQQ